ncbi:AraC family transcriptional regulator [Caballeronia sp. BR00000012568055]|uniref:helix-turn-helix domain-containing protein n=1 Tax=Caballeronia sp. BR00000012568055 TaxID=2918761 RepID=UPI0023F85695|nr:AraC family transcriptional regulator [Caballeronia sp. BR00000012568055]
MQDTRESASTPPRAKDSLGCQANRLRKDQEIDAGEFTFFRKCTLDDNPSTVATPASGRGFLVGVALSAGHRRRIFNGVRSSVYDFDQHTVYVRDFAEDYRADLQRGFDFVLIELSRAFVSKATYESGAPSTAGVYATPGHKDLILGHLAQVLALTLDGHHDASPLFIEQLGVAVGTHLIEHYGAAPSRALKVNRRLSALQEARAKEMLLASAQGRVSIEDIALACNLSRSYFIRAFKETTHRTPYQWLIEQRIDQARNLLMHSDAPLSDIAVSCGFNDQSHFTRIFSQMMGTPPGAWRRLRISH